MDLTEKPKAQEFSHRGIIGIEVAIVLIAFVIVAAGLAFVVLNMGFETSQKAKTTIGSGLTESSSIMKVSGRVFGSGHVVPERLNVTAIPIKIVAGGNSLNLAETNTVVNYLSNTIEFSDIYQGTINPGVQNSLQSATAAAKGLSYIDQDPYVDNAFPSQTSAFIYWAINNNNNDILDHDEHAFLVIVFEENDRPAPLDKMRVEILVARGAALTVERHVPSITSENIDLG